MKKFTIVPKAGLANRMRAIASGIFITKSFDSQAILYWIKKSECNAAFEELFAPLQLEKISIITVGPNKFTILPPSKKNLYIFHLLRMLIYKKQINNFNKNDGNIFDLLPLHGNIYLSSCHSMAPHYPLKELFIPTKEINTSIDLVKSKFSSFVVGIHIRRTDNVQAIKKNSVDDFKSQINKLLENNPEMKFFLATDSNQVKNDLIKSYGESIIIHEAVLHRDSLQGMKDAVVDLWCLSSTKYIIGSYYSSFSELAAELGGIELIIIESTLKNDDFL